MSRILRRSQDGYVMVTALIALAVMSILAAAAIAQANTALRMTGQAVRSEQALYLANAGVEMILARIRNAPLDEENQPAPEIEENAPYTYSMELEPGLVGSYEVVVTLTGSTAQIHSTGTVEGTSRVIEAQVPLSGDDDGGDDGGGGAPIPDQLAFGHGPMKLENNADICGDLYTTGNLKLENNVTIWNKTNAQDTKSPCEAIYGTGQVVVMGELTNENNVAIPGGWCDATDYGPSTPCQGNPPHVGTLPPPDFAKLKARATRWYVKASDAAYCDDKPADTCQTLNGTLSLTGSQTYSDDLVYVDGNLKIDKERGDGLSLTGSVTFVVTGSVSIEADLTCSDETNCLVGIIAGQSIKVEQNNVTVHATMQTLGELKAENSITIRGYLVAASMTMENNLLLYPPAAGIWPPAMHAGGDGSAAPAPPPEGYSGWSQ